MDNSSVLQLHGTGASCSLSTNDRATILQGKDKDIVKIPE